MKQFMVYQINPKGTRVKVMDIMADGYDAVFGDRIKFLGTTRAHLMFYQRGWKNRIVASAVLDTPYVVESRDEDLSL